MTALQGKGPEGPISRALKYSLLAFTFLFWGIGGIFIGVGGWAAAQKSGYSSLTFAATDPAFVIIAVGIFMFLVNFCGVVGTLRENTCLLQTYKFILVFVLLLAVIGGLLAFAFWPEAKKTLKSKLSNAVGHYSRNPDLMNLIDTTQRVVECCGVATYDDWDADPYFNCNSKSFKACGVPWSCCKHAYQKNRQCGYGLRRHLIRLQLDKHINTQGCLDKSIEYFRSHMFTVAGVAIGFTLPIVVGIIMAHIFVQQIKEQIATWDTSKTYL